MVQLKDFILIENEKDFDVNKFYADCEPFIQKIRGIEEKYLPKHGSRTAPRTWEIRGVARRERPRDAPVELHNAVDDYFEARFGWRARSQSIFTTGIYDVAAEYGPVALCFPIGKNFQTLWGKGVEDLYNLFLFLKKEFLPRDKLGRPIYVPKDEMDKMMPTIIEKAIEKMIKNISWFHNSYPRMGYESGSEVLINAEKVYLISMFTDEHDEVINHLKSLRLIGG